LGQIIIESPDSNVAPHLEFFIEIEFSEIEFEDEKVKPFFRGSNIVVSADSWRALENSKYEFPWMPKPGSIDAGVLAFGIRNPADLLALKFGAAKEGKLAVSFEMEVDFEIEADRDEIGQVKVEIAEFPLELDSLKIATALARRLDQDSDQIENTVRAVVDSSAYGSISKVPGGFEMGVTV
jgi:hypothetical protein